MINTKPVGISLLIFNLVAAYLNLINIIAVGRPFFEHIKTLFIFTNLLIIIQNIVYFPISILLFINAIHILKLKPYAIKELFVLIAVEITAYFITNFLIVHNIFLVLKDSIPTILLWLIVIFYFTRPQVIDKYKITQVCARANE